MVRSVPERISKGGGPASPPKLAPRHPPRLDYRKTDKIVEICVMDREVGNVGKARRYVVFAV